MMRVFKVLAGLLFGLLALIATGCKANSYSYVYGMPPPLHDPTVALTEFSYTPAEGAHVGDRLTFTAVINQQKLLDGGYVEVRLGDPATGPGNFLVELHDYGTPPDVTAGDGIWSGEYVWPPTLAPESGLLVFARLYWADGFVNEPLSAAPLTILPAEEE